MEFFIYRGRKRCITCNRKYCSRKFIGNYNAQINSWCSIWFYLKWKFWIACGNKYRYHKWWQKKCFDKCRSCKYRSSYRNWSRLQRIYFLRGGVGNVQRYIPDDLYEEAWTLQPNIGLGLVIGPVHLDYAYTNIGKQSEVLYSHVFSLMFDINKSVKPETIAE